MNKEIVSTPDAPSAIGPYSQAVKTGLVVFTSGQIGLDPASGELRQDFEAQVRQLQDWRSGQGRGDNWRML